MTEISHTDRDDLSPKEWSAVIYRLTELAERTMWWMHKGTANPSDTVSSTLRTYWRQVEAGDETLPPDPESLLRVLAEKLEKKIDAARKSQDYQKNGAARFSELAPHRDGSASEGNVSQPRVGLEQVEAYLAEIDLLLRDAIEDEDLLQIARMKVEGYTHAEIGKRMKLNEHQVARRLSKVRDALMRAGVGDE